MIRLQVIAPRVSQSDAKIGRRLIHERTRHDPSLRRRLVAGI